MPARKKTAALVVNVVETKNDSPKAVVKAANDVGALESAMKLRDLTEMQRAVMKAVGDTSDNRVSDAYDGVMSATNTGIAVQFIMQLIQRLKA